MAWNCSLLRLLTVQVSQQKWTQWYNFSWFLTLSMLLTTEIWKKENKINYSQSNNHILLAKHSQLYSPSTLQMLSVTCSENEDFTEAKFQFLARTKGNQRYMKPRIICNWFPQSLQKLRHLQEIINEIEKQNPQYSQRQQNWNMRVQNSVFQQIETE